MQGIRRCGKEIWIISCKEVYGKTLLYIENEPEKAAVMKLTGKSTVDERDIDALNTLGFQFDLKGYVPDRLKIKVDELNSNIDNAWNQNSSAMVGLSHCSNIIK